MFAFYGEYEHSLDDKGRVVIPVRYRPAFEDGYFVTRGLERCLWIFPLPTWEAVSEKLGPSPLTLEPARQLDRQFYAGIDGRLDRQGRFLIPPPLRDHASLDAGKPVVLVGVKNRIEIWKPEFWHEVTTEMKQSGRSFAAPLGEATI
jgi:MraZ protein